MLRIFRYGAFSSTSTQIARFSHSLLRGSFCLYDFKHVGADAELTPDPESYMLHREVQGEALTGETDGPAIEPRNQESGMPMLLDTQRKPKGQCPKEVRNRLKPQK